MSAAVHGTSCLSVSLEELLLGKSAIVTAGIECAISVELLTLISAQCTQRDRRIIQVLRTIIDA